MKIGLERILIAAAIGLLLIAVAGSVRGQVPGPVTQKAMISVEFDVISVTCYVAACQVALGTG